MQLDVRRGADRFVTDHGGGVVSRHSFSFGVHYDPANIGFGMLVSHNEDTLAPTSGYDEHPHRDLEVVTWVLEGSVRHWDTEGNEGLVVPGEVQVMGAGRGVRHAEHAGEDPTRFVQMWVRPDETGLEPRYVQEEIDLGDGWAEVPGIRSSRAALHATRLLPGGSTVPSAPYVHLFVCRGEATLETGEVLLAGDAVRLTDSEQLGVAGNAELLVWTMR